MGCFRVNGQALRCGLCQCCHSLGMAVCEWRLEVSEIAEGCGQQWKLGHTLLDDRLRLQREDLFTRISRSRLVKQHRRVSAELRDNRWIQNSTRSACQRLDGDVGVPQVMEQCRFRCHARNSGGQKNLFTP